MTQLFLPYGSGRLDCSVLEGLDPLVLESELSAYVPEASQEELVDRALLHPIGTPALSELARGKRKVVLLCSDHTRPVPSRILVPRLLREIRRGAPLADITLLIATGCHRGTTEAELREKFGDEIYEREHIVVHDCDSSDMADLGRLPSGGRLLINRLAAEAELLVAEGFIEPHFFAGFSGSRKAVLPGVAERHTVMYNHNGGFIDSPYARTGILENNPIHEDMVFAARKAGLDFILNVVIDQKKRIVYAVSGDLVEAHLRGCGFLREKCTVSSKAMDLVVTSNGGYPLDQNIYQAVKGMTAAEKLVKESGVIIMAAECRDGHGGEGFFNTFRDEKDLKRMISSFIATPPEDTMVDQWQSQILARVLCRASVIFISEMPDEMVRNFQMIPAHSMAEALDKAGRLIKKESWDTAFIPDGVSVITELQK